MVDDSPITGAEVTELDIKKNLESLESLLGNMFQSCPTRGDAGLEPSFTGEILYPNKS